MELDDGSCHPRYSTGGNSVYLAQKYFIEGITVGGLKE